MAPVSQLSLVDEADRLFQAAPHAVERLAELRHFVAAIFVVWQGHPWLWALGIVAAGHALWLWATLVPACEWWGPVMSRLPTSDELTTATKYLDEQSDQRQAAEDLLWTLLNSREFVFNH